MKVLITISVIAQMLEIEFLLKNSPHKSYQLPNFPSNEYIMQNLKC